MGYRDARKTEKMGMHSGLGMGLEVRGSYGDFWNSNLEGKRIRKGRGTGACTGETKRSPSQLSSSCLLSSPTSAPSTPASLQGCSLPERLWALVLA